MFWLGIKNPAFEGRDTDSSKPKPTSGVGGLFEAMLGGPSLEVTDFFASNYEYLMEFEMVSLFAVHQRPLSLSY